MTEDKADTADDDEVVVVVDVVVVVVVALLLLESRSLPKTDTVTSLTKDFLREKRKNTYINRYMYTFCISVYIDMIYF